MDLKISLNNQLYALKELIITSLFYFVFIGFLYTNVDISLFKILFLSTLIFYVLVFCLPVLILHINHVNNNKYHSVKIEKNKLTIGDVSHNNDDIERVNIFATYQHFNNSVGVSALPYNDYYYHLEICLKEGGTIILSSLLDYKIDTIFKKNFDSVEIVEKPSTFISLLI